MLPAVEIKNISKKFKAEKKEFYALKEVSFDVKEGEIFGILGPNGAGKTTLINILSTALLPDQGTAKIFGLDIFKDRKKILQQINMVSGETRFHYLLKVKDILKLYSSMYDIPDEKRKSRINELMEKLEINHLKDRIYDQLSTGEKMRVTIAKSLINYPKLIIYDEPTIGLDPDIAIKVREMIKEVNRNEGTTILLTSHYMFEVEELCMRIAFINKGVVSDIGTVQKLKAAKFPRYEVKIKVAKLKNKEILKENGFRVDGNNIYKEIENEKDPSELIRFLVKNNFDVLSFETKNPTLEQYFLKMTRDKK